MDRLSYIDGGISIALGFVLLALSRGYRRIEGSEKEVGWYHLRLRRVIALALIGCGVILIAIHSFSHKPKNSTPPFPPWETVTTTDGVLTLLMPGKPDVQSQESESELGRIRRVKHSVSLDGGSLVFSVNEIHYLDESLKFHANEFITEAARTTIANARGTLVSERSIQAGSIEGKEVVVRITTSEGRSGNVWMRFFLVGKCAYQVKVSNPEVYDDRSIISRYFDSVMIKAPSS